MTTNNLIKKSANNFVLQDGVIKEQVEQEYITRMKWDERWSFINAINQNCIETARQKGITREENKRTITKGKAAKLPAVSTWDPVPSGPVPRTTTGEVGWRSARKECNLEQLGRLYISPKFTIDPPGSSPIKNYKFIYLG